MHVWHCKFFNMHLSVAWRLDDSLDHATLYHGHPCPSFWLGPEFPLGIARLSFRQEGRTRVEVMLEGELINRHTYTQGILEGIGD